MPNLTLPGDSDGKTVGVPLQAEIKIIKMRIAFFIISDNNKLSMQAISFFLNLKKLFASAG